MASAVIFPVAALALLVVGYKFVRSGATAAPVGVRHLCFAIALFSISLALLTPASLRLASEIEPFPHFTQLLANGLGLIGAHRVHAMLAYSLEPPDRARRRLRAPSCALLLVLAVLIVCAFGSRTPAGEPFGPAKIGDPYVLAYLLVLHSYLTWTIALLVSRMRRYLPEVTAAEVRAGLRVAVIGGWFGLCWVLWRGVSLLTVHLLGMPVSLTRLVDTVLAACAVALLAIGGSLTSLGAWWQRPASWLRRRRALRAITPLWLDIRATVPEVVLPSGGVVGTELTLYRRIIEIRDAQLALRWHVHPSVADWVREKEIEDPRQLAVLTEAAALATALLAKDVGKRYAQDAPIAEPPVADADIDAETTWLSAVARAYAQDPSIDAVRERMRDTLSIGEVVA
ncbi:hypothetical protein EV191_101903 [Tamaricihabitans halophyticus]|uniref:DUF6545 domain-containing protein n=1 Tax=Tamaricihabitans halophyticus TaxID=1262583 RepID=A0A4R2R4U6_9PSEU|nr:MAB_1171c family putative transporter [Tamaricihabitans halophyticus]TCP56954.1 hypothetical protein EV191_101903 [Tamaricihabitans halophyticus]